MSTFLTGCSITFILYDFLYSLGYPETKENLFQIPKCLNKKTSASMESAVPPSFHKEELSRPMALVSLKSCLLCYLFKLILQILRRWDL